MVISIMLVGNYCFAETKASPAKGAGSKIKTSNAKPFTLVIFWSEGCSTCAATMEFLRGVAPRFSSMTVKDYEVWNDRQNSQLMSRVARAYDFKLAGVPVTFIDKKGYTGFSRQNQQMLLDEMERCSVEDCADPLDVLAAAEGNTAPLSKQAEAIEGVCSISKSSEQCK